MIITKPIEERVTEAIYKAIMQAVSEELDKQLININKIVEAKVRERVGGIAATVCNKLTFERFGTDLRIHVQFTEQQNPSPH